MKGNDMMTKPKLSCVDCAAGSCDEIGKALPRFCTTTNLPTGEKEAAVAAYTQNEDYAKIMHSAAATEYEGYGHLTRVQETIEFAKKMGYQTLGIATCVGLLKESRQLAKLLRAHGFTVYGVGCKVGMVTKTELGIDDACMAIGPHSCNPILQAQRLAEEGTEFNIVVGLCVGHDSLFYLHSKVPTTTLIAKDRVTGHNPAVVLYQLDSYYEKLYPPKNG